MADTSQPITLTERAARRIADLVEQEGAPNGMLRVAVSGGGCSGFQYGFSLDHEVQEGDVVVERGQAQVVIDNLSLMYLAGAEHWSTWWPAIRDELLAKQASNGPWLDHHAGGAYATAMSLIILQMPKRYLPIFQR